MAYDVIDKTKAANGIAEADPQREQIEGNLHDIDLAIAECRRILGSSEMFNSKTAQEYENMLREMRQEATTNATASDVTKKKVEENIPLLLQTKAEAEEYYRKFNGQLDTAIRNEWINESMKGKWMVRFFNPNLLEWTRKAWLDEHFPAYIESHKKIGDKRKEVLKKAKEQGINKKEFADFAKIESKDAFFTQPEAERKGLVDKLDAFLTAKETKQELLYFNTELLLKDATSGSNRYMHSSKIGKWLKHTMDSSDPQAFIEKTLMPYLTNWKQIRSEFDDVERDMKTVGEPWGFATANLDEFLLWEYPQRKSYIELARIAMMQQATNSEQKEHGELFTVKVLIRQELAMNDWASAEVRLQKADAKFPGDPDIASMQSFLDAHRTDTKEEEVRSDEEITNETNQLISSMPIQARDMTAACANDSWEAVGTLGGLYFNRVWATQKGFSNEQQEMADAKDKSLKEATDERRRFGHTKEMEKNVIEGSTEDVGSIRGDCTSPQIVYTKANANAQNKVASAAIQYKGKGSFSYWTSVVPDGLSYSQHEELVSNVFWRIKGNVRELENRGINYQTPNAGGTAVEEEKEVPTEALPTIELTQQQSKAEYDSHLANAA